MNPNLFARTEARYRRIVAAVVSLFRRKPVLTIAGRLPIVSSHEELDALIAARHAKGSAARKGWQTRRAAKREGGANG